jgi:hypothetical protein
MHCGDPTPTYRSGLKALCPNDEGRRRPVDIYAEPRVRTQSLLCVANFPRTLRMAFHRGLYAGVANYLGPFGITTCGLPCPI